MIVRSRNTKSILRGSVAAALLCATLIGAAPVRAADEGETLEELRNTVINLLDGLVQKGVLTKEQAQAMVQDAQNKAAAQAKARADLAAQEQGAVRVTHVPEIVKQEIRAQVREELRPEVTKDVMAQAKAERWGVPGALPEWVNNLTLFGDIRLRAQADEFASDNLERSYDDVLAINSRGGYTEDRLSYLNTTNDRLRERIRMRLGLNAKIASGVSAGIRLTSGNLLDPVSTNQTLGQSSSRYAVAIDQAYLKFDAGQNTALPWMTVWGGRMPSPWFSSDLVFDPDLQFEGVASTWRVGIGGAGDMTHAFLTAGAFPLQEIQFSTKDKWLYGGQLGFDWFSGGGTRARIAASYYYYDNIIGQLNEPGSNLLDYTAPQWVQKGNSLWNIRNGNANQFLYALASEYHLQNVTAGIEMPALGHKILFNADYVRNVAFDRAEVSLRTGRDVTEATEGYQAELGFGSLQTLNAGNWRFYLAYRYLEKDAVVDGFTDSDFHLGGTNSQGYILRGEWWFRTKASIGMRYLSASEIEGLPVGVDTFMLDLNGQF